MDARFGVDLATQIRNRKLLDPELKQKEVKFHPELPDNEDWLMSLLFVGRLLVIYWSSIIQPSRVKSG